MKKTIIPQEEKSFLRFILNKQEKLPMRTTAVISAYRCKINNYNISSGDKLVILQQTFRLQI